MTDAIETALISREALQDIRQRLRRERQARVGILRNPNHPPKPAARRMPLTGKWLNLRSSRRPQPAPSPLTPDPDSAPARVTPGRPAVQTAEDGRVLSVDVAGLMASVDERADLPARRAPFAAEYRHDVRPQRRATDPGDRRQTTPSILSAEAWLDELDTPKSTGASDADTYVRHGQNTRPRDRWGTPFRLFSSMLGGMALAVLILLALLGPPP